MIVHYLLMRDLGWGPEDCRRELSEYKTLILAVNRIDKRIQGELMRDKRWQEQQAREQGRSGSRSGGKGQETYTIPMDEWTPDFFEKLRAGEMPQTRSQRAAQERQEAARATTPDMTSPYFQRRRRWEEGEDDEEDLPE